MALSALNEQKDPEIITNIFEIQLLERFEYDQNGIIVWLVAKHKEI